MSNAELRSKLIELMNAYGDARGTRNELLIKSVLPAVMKELRELFPDETQSNETTQEE